MCYENVLKYLYTQSISSGFFWMFFCEFPDKNEIRFAPKCIAECVYDRELLW